MAADFGAEDVFPLRACADRGTGVWAKPRGTTEQPTWQSKNRLKRSQMRSRVARNLATFYEEQKRKLSNFHKKNLEEFDNLPPDGTDAWEPVT